jgi:cyclopropane fatty-acyl-phospholipid synthase-like methyltransferase
LDNLNLYNNEFYEKQVDGAYLSARKYVSVLNRFYVPTSVIDIGCGRGAWLKAFYEANSLVCDGLDGPWNSQNNMLTQAIRFRATDLNKINFENSKKYDLAISLEVAEHLKPEAAENFISQITSVAEVVIFGAAYTKQGGGRSLK